MEADVLDSLSEICSRYAAGEAVPLIERQRLHAELMRDFIACSRTWQSYVRLRLGHYQEIKEGSARGVASEEAQERFIIEKYGQEAVGEAKEAWSRSQVLEQGMATLRFLSAP
jgi:hypothetical protein